MNSNKPLYKVISLLLKTTIFVLSIWYIFQKLTNADTTLNFDSLVTKTNWLYFSAALLLVIFNWGIEAAKWKYMIQKIERISYPTALKSILSGVTISIFTPNRMGEFAGRVFYLKNADKLKATFISLIGSGFQLLITLLTGIIAGLIYYNQNDASFLSIISVNNVLFILVIVLLLTIISYLLRNSILKKIKDVLHLFSFKERSVIFSLSLLRYMVFSFQYYLILQVFGIDTGLLNSFILIVLTFFVTSAIPSFALTEITVRGAASVYFFSTISSDTSSIITSSIVLWIINLAIPALIGGVFIWDLKFFKDQ
jgi:uncharacterized protein with PQ loop repeat